MPTSREPVAIIGLSGRFPGAATPTELWHNLRNGVESICRFTEDALIAAGLPRDLISRRNYVKAAPVLDNFDSFDAGFFTIPPREAELMDPEHRIFLEVCWEALESARLAGSAERARIGVFASGGGLFSSYLVSRHHFNSRLAGDTAGVEQIGNDKDFLATRVSYRLNLRGPAYSVQCGCSSSLAAVHLACQSLRSGECETALAGGVSLRIPHISGYQHEEDGILSPDGHCRPFDAQAQGTLFGSGAGCVVLKLLDRAFADRDEVLAVILGSAMNNDGGEKISFWSTTAERQADCMLTALANAGVVPASIGLVEAHGTATSVGDIVEAAALRMAYGERAAEAQGVLGSVKANLGHLEAAAGIVSLVKTVLALRNRVLPRTLHFRTPNPKTQFECAAFRPRAEDMEWSCGQWPRRAAVNSLGVGGTNVHMVLEEGPAPRGSARSSKQTHLLTISARTDQALRLQAERWAAMLSGQEGTDIEVVCHDANYGRRHFEYRAALMVSSCQEAAEGLRRLADSEPLTYCEPSEAVAAEGWSIAAVREHYLRGGALPPADPGACGRWTGLPTYPFERRRFWIEPEPIAPPASHPLLGRRLDLAATSEIRYESRISPYNPAYLDHHRVYGKVVALGVGYLEMALAAARELFQTSSLVLENVTIERALVLEDGETRTLQFVARVDADAASFEIFSRPGTGWIRHASGSVRPGRTAPVETNLSALQRRICAEISADEYYARLSVYYGPLLRNLERLWMDGGEEALGKARVSATAQADTEYVLHPALLDACFQAVFAILYKDERTATAWVPVGVQRLTLFQSAPLTAWSHVTSRCGRGSVDAHTFDVDVLADTGHLICRVEGLQLVRIQRNALLPAFAAADLLYKIDWEPVSPPSLVSVVQTCRTATAVSDGGELRVLLDRLSTALAGEALRRAEDCAPRHRSYLARLREFAGDATSISEIEQELVLRYPEASVERKLLLRCGRSVAEVLAGRLDPLEVLFGSGGDDSGIADLNAVSPSFAAGLQVLARVARELTVGRRGLQVLEVGAGTGSATAAVLPVISDAVSRYVFTDVTPAFLAPARGRFSRYRGMEYRTFDLERDPAEQGFDRQSFDIVLAGNVVHAASRIRTAVHRLLQLLRPGGTLVLLEGTAQRNWIDLIFGLTDGWWKFKGDPDRERYPLLPPDAWSRVLQGAGYVAAEWIEASSADDPFPQIVLMAEAPHAECLAPEVVLMGAAGWEQALETIQGWQHRTVPPRGFLVRTERAVPTAGDIENPDQATLWGLGRIVQLEHPEWHCRLVDCEGPEELDVLLRHPDETLLAVRNGRSFAPRLERLVSVADEPITFERDAAYLITGGLGGLGLQVARWMAARGAGELILLGRRNPVQRANALVDELRAAGAVVQVVHADLASGDELTAALTPFLARLHGVVHAAGVLSDAALVNQSEKRFREVLAPKVTGAWHLHELTRNCALEFFVLFSSVVGVLGSRGQANHAAANTFLDAFAWWRRARGLPALSINWGPWGDTGAAADSAIQEHWKGRGIEPMSPQQGLAALEAAIRSGETQVLAASIDWKKFDIGDSRLYLRLRPKGTVTPPIKTSAATRQDTTIHDILADVLGIDRGTRIDPRRGFADLGLDSLAALDFRNRLQAWAGRPLPATVAFDYPTIESLTGHLQQRSAAAAAGSNGVTGRVLSNPVETVETELASVLETLGY